MDSTATTPTSNASHPVFQPEAGAAHPDPASINVLMIDLNNFSTFPTLAVGILLASLRNAGLAVQLISPLAHDVVAATRERREVWKDYVVRRIQLSTWRPFRRLQDRLRKVKLATANRAHPTVLSETAKSLAQKPDIVLLSAYLEHYPTVAAICALAADKGIPVLLGGPAFNFPRTVEAWRSIKGVTAIVGAEVDLSLPDMVREICKGGDLLKFDGVTLPDGRKSSTSKPLRGLDQIPVPDFTDFPWDRYKFRVIPLMTGRGCQWDRCTFCSDIVTASGRTYRTRSVDSVLNEMRELSNRHQTTNFLFLDLKLNSNPSMLRGLSEQVQRYVPGAQWVGTVHVDQRKDNGLSYRDIRAAVAGGMRRVSFGLESGSQRLLDLMDKGCNIDSNAQFIRDAHQAGLSVRCTMFKGYPGETAEDLEKTYEFLVQYGRYIDRLRFNEFALIENTKVFETFMSSNARYPQIEVVRWDYRNALTRHINTDSESRAYRQAKAKVLKAVFEINRRQVRPSARAFDGLM